MLADITFAAVTLAQMSSQTTPMLPLAPQPQLLDSGPCLDSPRTVPMVLQAPVERSMQIVRIDKVISTSTLQSGDVIGFVYTLADGSTWLGHRTPRFMSGAAAESINEVLANAHQPGNNISAFPPEYNHGIPTKKEQFFRVQMSPGEMAQLRIAIQPCVAWPAGRPLPDPMM